MWYDQIKEKMNNAKKSTGKVAKWPYSKMDVGDIVYVEHGQYGNSKPDVYAHVYGASRMWKFSTKRMPDGKFMITRTA